LARSELSKNKRKLTLNKRKITTGRVALRNHWQKHKRGNRVDEKVHHLLTDGKGVLSTKRDKVSNL